MYLQCNGRKTQFYFEKTCFIHEDEFAGTILLNGYRKSTLQPVRSFRKE